MTLSVLLVRFLCNYFGLRTMKRDMGMRVEYSRLYKRKENLTNFNNTETDIILKIQHAIRLT